MTFAVGLPDSEIKILQSVELSFSLLCDVQMYE